jgi:D-alanyl-D-alanine dipeptidase
MGGNRSNALHCSELEGAFDARSIMVDASTVVSLGARGAVSERRRPDDPLRHPVCHPAQLHRRSRRRLPRADVHLTRPTAEALRRAQQDFLEQGFALKVYDWPQRAVDDFVAWAQDLPDQRMKAEFYPLPEGSTRPYAPGEQLVDFAAPQAVRCPDESLDMGTGYDCFDTLAHTLDPRVQGEQLKNRLLLKDGLEQSSLTD